MFDKQKLNDKYRLDTDNHTAMINIFLFAFKI